MIPKAAEERLELVVAPLFYPADVEDCHDGVLCQPGTRHPRKDVHAHGLEKFIVEDVLPMVYLVNHLGVLEGPDHSRYERGAEGELPQIPYLGGNTFYQDLYGEKGGEFFPLALRHSPSPGPQ